jgi:hypothetical protein
MLQSHIIELDGVFVGAAIRIDRGYRFVATDFRLEELDSTIWPTLDDVRRVARRALRDATSAGPISPSLYAPSHRTRERSTEPWRYQRVARCCEPPPSPLPVSRSACSAHASSRPAVQEGHSIPTTSARRASCPAIGITREAASVARSKLLRAGCPKGEPILQAA